MTGLSKLFNSSDGKMIGIILSVCAALIIYVSKISSSYAESQTKIAFLVRVVDKQADEINNISLSVAGLKARVHALENAR